MVEVQPREYSLVKIYHDAELGGSELDAKAFQEHVPRDIEWNSVNFKVGKTTILRDCWGNVKAGEVCAMMGPSGAGKSSLLNVLAGRSAPAPGISVTGNVTVAGRPINPVAFRRNIAYVMQDDALMATQTPRDALRFSASLRLPAKLSQQEIDALVDKTLVDLGLDGCSDVLIGGPMIKGMHVSTSLLCLHFLVGISGGQRKRTSIGIEIITNPALLFLDGMCLVALRSEY